MMSSLAIKAIIAAIGLAAIIGAGTWFVVHQRHIGRDAAIAQMVKETDAETARRHTVIAEARKVAEAAATKLQLVEAKNVNLLQQIETLSARNDAVGCLDADAVERLRRLSEPDRR